MLMICYDLELVSRMFTLKASKNIVHIMFQYDYYFPFKSITKYIFYCSFLLFHSFLNYKFVKFIYFVVLKIEKLIYTESVSRISF